MPEEPSVPNSGTSGPSNFQTIVFMAILSLTAAFILSVLASALEKPQELAKDLDRSKQMLISAKMLDPEGFFLIQDKEGNFIPAKNIGDGVLEPSETKEFAAMPDILSVYNNRLQPRLVDSEGKLLSFEEAGVNQDSYLADYKKTGYYKAPLKLVYLIMPNGRKDAAEKDKKPLGYIIPVNGFGLWDAIYGYLALEPDGNTVIGITWYDQKETPGLGANIAEPSWQNQFFGKQIFQESPDGKTDYQTAPIGIVVVKGKVENVLGNSPKAKSAVDGMAGATLTGNGVTDAYRSVLSAYRPFLVRIAEENTKLEKQTKD